MTESTSQQFIHIFDTIARCAHRNSKAKGFWDASEQLQEVADAAGMGTALRKMRGSQLRDLMHSELGEACEGDRKDLQSDKIAGFSNVEEEYADLVIRLMDAAIALGLRLPEAIIAKMLYNQGRPAMHGGKSF